MHAEGKFDLLYTEFFHGQSCHDYNHQKVTEHPEMIPCFKGVDILTLPQMKYFELEARTQNANIFLRHEK